jgi:hypothetical protein
MLRVVAFMQITCAAKPSSRRRCGVEVKRHLFFGALMSFLGRVRDWLFGRFLQRPSVNPGKVIRVDYKLASTPSPFSNTDVRPMANSPILLPRNPPPIEIFPYLSIPYGSKIGRLLEEILARTLQLHLALLQPLRNARHEHVVHSALVSSIAFLFAERIFGILRSGFRICSIIWRNAPPLPGRSHEAVVVFDFQVISINHGGKPPSTIPCSGGVVSFDVRAHQFA